MKKPLKVLILIDDVKVKKWVADIVQFVLESPHFNITAVVVNTATTASKSSLFYRTIRFFDRKIFKFRTNPFAIVKLPVLDEIIYTTFPIQKQFSDWLDDDCLNFIASNQPDIILRFGFRILRGEILKMAKFGIWSLHHGDNRINRGGPPAFWEVVNQEPISGVTLQQISEDLDGGKVIGRAFTKTDLTSFNRNQVIVFETGVKLFQEKLLQFALGKLNVEKNCLDSYCYPLYKNPSNKESFFITIHFLFRVLKKSFSNIFYGQQWVISHSKTNSQEESIYRFQNLIPPKGISWADPFPIEEDGKLYLFAEEIIGKGLGKIICFEYSDKEKRFTNPTSVIQKDYHLSYPNVFKYKDQWYMIPETGETGKVIIFKSIDFPYQWEEVSVIIENKKLYDVTPFEYQNRWYCFATERFSKSCSPNDLLNLYLLDNGPLGNWRLHPSSPIKVDVRGGRSAGKIFERDGKTFRPAQLGAPKYGYATQFYEILHLDEENYQEQLVDTILPNWQKNLLATHTFNTLNGWHFIDYQRKVRKF